MTGDATAVTGPLAAEGRPIAAEGRVLVVGIGNTLRGDDAAGWGVVDRVSADPRLAGARIAWHQQLTPELAQDLADATLVVLVDAEVGVPPGRVTARRLEADWSGGPILSHHVTPSALLALARELYGSAPETWVVSVGALALEPGDPVSPAVADALPAAAESVVAIVEGRADA